MRLRRYEPADRPAVLALATRLTAGVAPWRDPDAVRDAARGWVTDPLDAAESSGSATFVAESGGTLLGLVTVGERRHFTGEVDGYVGALAVAAGQERQGIGRALMQAAEQWARDRGRSRLTLETGAANHAARSFYMSLGYEEEDVRLSRSRPPAPTAGAPVTALENGGR